MSKSIRTKRPVKLSHIKRVVREVNTTPYSASGEGDKALFNERRKELMRTFGQMCEGVPACQSDAELRKGLFFNFVVFLYFK